MAILGPGTEAKRRHPVAVAHGPVVSDASPVVARELWPAKQRENLLRRCLAHAQRAMRSGLAHFGRDVLSRSHRVESWYEKAAGERERSQHDQEDGQNSLHPLP